MKYIDLSHPISNLMSTYPSDPNVIINEEKNIQYDNTLLHSFNMGTHTGTHLDAPAHIINDGKTFDDYDLNYFAGNALKVDTKNFKILDNINDKIDGVIFDSGWYKNFNNSKIFYGTDRPVIPNELVKKLVEIGVKFFGCDLPSVDSSGSKDKPIHNALLSRDIIIYESLTNLDQLPLDKIFQFYGFPLPFEKLDGSPVRAVAIMN